MYGARSLKYGDRVRNLRRMVRNLRPIHTGRWLMRDTPAAPPTGIGSVMYDGRSRKRSAAGCHPKNRPVLPVLLGKVEVGEIIDGDELS